MLDTAIAWLLAHWSEVLGFATGFACVVLAARRNVWTFPIGIANNLVFIALFASSGLYAAAGLQGVFLVLGAHGWWRWGTQPERDVDYVRRTPARAVPVLILCAIAGTALLWWLLATFTDSRVAFWDGSTTAASLVAQYMLNRKWIQTWLCWAAVDVVFAALAASQGLWITAVLYVVFIGVCLSAYVGWRRALPAGPADASPAPSPTDRVAT